MKPSNNNEKLVRELKNIFSNGFYSVGTVLDSVSDNRAGNRYGTFGVSTG